MRADTIFVKCDRRITHRIHDAATADLHA